LNRDISGLFVNLRHDIRGKDCAADMYTDVPGGVFRIFFHIGVCEQLENMVRTDSGSKKLAEPQ
jgi:hypothetical protein